MEDVLSKNGQRPDRIAAGHPGAHLSPRSRPHGARGASGHEGAQSRQKLLQLLVALAGAAPPSAQEMVKNRRKYKVQRGVVSLMPIFI